MKTNEFINILNKRVVHMKNKTNQMLFLFGK